MASRTQLRLEQLTGSFDVTNGINDQIAASATGSINASSLQDILSHMAGAIKRVHGEDSFSEGTAGIISGSHGIVDFSGTSAFGGGNFGTIRGLNGSGVLNRLDLVGTTVALFGNTTERLAILNNGVTRFKDSAGETVINITAAGTNQVQIGGTDADVIPGTNSASSLGITGTRWSNLFTDAATITNNLTVGGDATVAGSLTITGDIDYQYVTSSVVEFNDPMIVTNAIDSSDNAGLQFTSASFAHAPAETEGTTGGSENSYDYGVVWKRSLGYSSDGGAHVDIQETTVPGEVTGPGDDFYDSQTDGSPFAVFKQGGAVNNTHGNATDNALIAVGLDPNVRSDVNQADMLDAMRGAYVIVSGSNAKKLGVITSGSNAKEAVEIRVLGDTDVYGTLTQTDDTLNSADIKAIHLLNAYGGTIFDKLDSTFHMAAAAITGSSDNNFISGSANILQYGSVAAAKLSLYNNDILSGSTEILSAEWGNEADVIVKSLNSNDLVLSGSGALKLTANDNHLILGSSFAGVANEQLLTVNAQGEILGVDRSTVAAAGDSLAKFGFKVTQTINAGNVDFGSSKTAGISALTIGAADLAISAAEADLNKSLEVFVNGQLLVSGSDGNVDADYTYIDADTLKFAFGLEAGDIVQIIQR